MRTIDLILEDLRFLQIVVDVINLVVIVMWPSIGQFAPVEYQAIVVESPQVVKSQ